MLPVQYVQFLHYVLARNDTSHDNGEKQEPSQLLTISSHLCVVQHDGGVYPLCTHEDDVETVLFIDP